MRLKLLVAILICAAYVAPSDSLAKIANLSEFELVQHIPLLAQPTNGTDYSGIAYNDDTGTLFMISNDTTNIFEYTVGGAYLRTITGSGFADTEDIVYMGDNKFAVVEEGNKAISILNIGPTTTSVSKSGALQVINPSAPAGNLGNTGFEGLAYNSTSNLFYVVKEMSSRATYQVTMSGTATSLSSVTTALNAHITDYSGAYFDNSPGGNLYVLSHQSNKIVEVTLGGVVKGTFTQPGTQVEGITFSTNGRHMFVIGEDRDFYHYAVPEPASLALSALGAIGALFLFRVRHGKKSAL